MVSVYDSRPFFEKALQFGMQHGLINQARMDAINADAPKGMVQIARYFGSEFLRPELEKARERLVNLVSLYLESNSGGDLRRAAESLRDHSFLSRSKGGSDMLKALLVMLLLRASGRRQMPDWVTFEKMIAALRKKHAPAGSASLDITLPARLPAELRAVVESLKQSVLIDMPKILDTALPVRQLFDRSPAFMGRYFWLDDGLHEVEQHDRQVSAAWSKVTGGNSDDGSLLTLLVCVAAGAAPKTLLTEKAAASLIRKIQKKGAKPGFDAELARQYLLDHAPAQHQEAYLSLWDEFVDEAEDALQSDALYAQQDALALLRRECHVIAA